MFYCYWKDKGKAQVCLPRWQIQQYEMNLTSFSDDSSNEDNFNYFIATDSLPFAASLRAGVNKSFLQKDKRWNISRNFQNSLQRLNGD